MQRRPYGHRLRTHSRSVRCVYYAVSDVPTPLRIPHLGLRHKDLKSFQVKVKRKERMLVRRAARVVLRDVLCAVIHGFILLTGFGLPAIARRFLLLTDPA